MRSTALPKALSQQPKVAEVKVAKLPLNINPTLTLSGNTTESREQVGQGGIHDHRGDETGRMNATELNALHNPLIVLLVMVVGLGAGLIYQLDQTLTSAKRELAQQQVQMREARTRLQKSGDEKDVIVRYLPSYQYLQRLGFVGDEQRLNWLEGLRLSNQQAQLFGVQYQIGSQQPYPYAAELDPGQLDAAPVGDETQFPVAARR